MRRSVDERLKNLGHPEVPIVDGDGPEVDEDVEQQVCELVHGEEKDVQVVGTALQKAVQRVKRMTRVRRRNLEITT